MTGGIPAGALRHRVTIERYIVTEDPLGGGVKSWAALTTCWAAVTFGTGRERREAAQEAASAPATFHVRRNSVTKTITPADRIRFDGAEWDITSAVPSKGFNVGVDITAVRRAA